MRFENPGRFPERVVRPFPLAALVVLVVGAGAAAQDLKEGPRPDPTDDATSPRAALSHYLERCRQGDYTSAASFLTLGPADSHRGPELARRLKAVLDRHLWIDLEELSAAEKGDESDGLALGVDELGRIPLAGRPAPVRLARRGPSADAAWAFSSETVARVDPWYQALDDHWLRQRLPDALLRPGPFDVAWWQWAALPLVLLASWGLGRVAAWASLRIVLRIVRRTVTTWDDELVRGMAGPSVLAWSVASAHILIRTLALYPPAQSVVDRVVASAALLALIWAAWSAIGIAGDALAGSTWASGNGSARSVLSIGVRVGRVAVCALGAAALLSSLGYPVAGLVAGLGLGGLAFALAAQKTVENLFGSVSLAVDAPFRAGDFVKVEDFVGTVESIGLRSTRIRTLDRTLVTIPNGRLAEMRLESYTARDRMRLACTLGLVYGTRSDQMREVLKGLEAVLRAHPRIWPDAVVVRFKEFAPSSLDIDIMAWFCTSSWAEFQEIRQEVLLDFLHVVECAGTSFAFPTQTVHLVNGHTGESAGLDNSTRQGGGS